MKVVLDSSVLIYLAFPNTNAPLDPATGKPVTHCQQRIEGLIEDMDRSGVQLIIPTPVLSELLIMAGTRQLEVLGALTNKRSVQVIPFDEMAAIENASLRRGKLAKKSPGETKKEVSFDLQILAIARVVGADMILTDDAQLSRRCVQAGMKAVGLAEVPVPDSKRQMGMFATSEESKQAPASAENGESESDAETE